MEKETQAKSDEQRLALIGRMAASVVHELNNLLTVVRLNAASVDPEGPADDLKAALSQIESACERASVLTGKVMLFTRGSGSGQERIRVDQRLEALRPAFTAMGSQGIQVETKIRDADLWAKGKPGDVEQVVTDLVYACTDAAKGGGTVAVECGRSSDGIELRVSGRGAASPGPDDGLVEARLLVARAGATLNETTNDEGGRVFRVVWPAAFAEERRGEKAGRSTVLLVEDDDGIRSITRKLLERAGHRVLDTGSGEEALALWAANSATINLLLLDIALTGELSGRDVAEHVASSGGGGAPVLYMSGHFGLDASLSYLTVDNFLPKPFHPSELLAAVSDSLARGIPQS